MVDLSDLRPGMKIKIVDHWGPGCYPSWDGRMDHWLGKIVTVLGVDEYPDDVFGPSVHIVEDRAEGLGNGWCWFPAAIDCIVQDEELLPKDHDFSPAADTDFLSILPGRPTKQIQKKEERT